MIRSEQTLVGLGDIAVQGVRKTKLSREAAGPDSVVGLSSDGNVVASTRRLRCQGRPQTARGGVQLS